MSHHPHPLDLLIRNLELRSPLSDVDKQQILQLPCQTKELEPGSYIVREADPPRQCGVLVSGFAFRQKLTGDGARQIIAIILPGNALDFQNLFLDVADHSVQMLTRGTVAFLSREQIQDLAFKNASIGHAIMVKMLVESAIYREWTLNVGRRDARTRVAHVLCELGTRLDALGLAKDYGYHLPMTQEELADAVGLTPVHVNRTLKVLEAEGLIVRDRRKVSFPGWGRLREVGDFNARYLHLQPQPGRPQARAN
jgi:CRP-like cAMP-binding protein